MLVTAESGPQESRVASRGGVTGAGAVVRSASAEILRILGDLIPAKSKCALVDFPNYPNVGDSAIWLGQRAFLKSVDAKVAYCCGLNTYSQSQMRRMIDGDSIILMQGGGNFGDIWHHHQRFREQVIRDFPNHRIVIFPHSILFKSADTLAQARQVIDGHGAVTILARDQRSLALARRSFASRSVLCPDMAFFLGTLRAPRRPSCEIVWLARTDAESLGYPLPPVTASLRHANWLQEGKWFSEARETLTGESSCLRQWWHQSYGPLLLAYDFLARMRVSYGLKLLSAGRCVITDMLHGFVLSLLMERPTV